MACFIILETASWWRSPAITRIMPPTGRQLQIETLEIKAPEDELSIERYLGSGAVKGIGVSLAARIVRKFHEDTFRIMEEGGSAGRSARHQ